MMSDDMKHNPTFNKFGSYENEIWESGTLSFYAANPHQAKKISERFNTLQAETDALRQRNEELESKLTGCENRYQRQNDVIQRLNEQVEKLEGQLDEAKDTVEWIGRKEDTANKRVAELEAIISDVHKNLSHWQAEGRKQGHEPFWHVEMAISRLAKALPEPNND